MSGRELTRPPMKSNANCRVALHCLCSCRQRRYCRFCSISAELCHFEPVYKTSQVSSAGEIMAQLVFSPENAEQSAALSAVINISSKWESEFSGRPACCLLPVTCSARSVRQQLSLSLREEAIRRHWRSEKAPIKMQRRSEKVRSAGQVE